MRTETGDIGVRLPRLLRRLAMTGLGFADVWGFAVAAGRCSYGYAENLIFDPLTLALYPFGAPRSRRERVFNFDPPHPDLLPEAEGTFIIAAGAAVRKT